MGVLSFLSILVVVVRLLEIEIAPTQSQLLESWHVAHVQRHVGSGAFHSQLFEGAEARHGFAKYRLPDRMSVNLANHLDLQPGNIFR